MSDDNAAGRGSPPRRRPVVIRSRSADAEHVVSTVIGGPSHCARPCPQCPWRIENDGTFPTEAFRLSAATAYDMARSLFGCHMTGATRPATCAGALLSTGAEHNLLIRLALMAGRFSWDQVSAAGAVLHHSYRAMAEANGVAHDDPILDGCR